MLGNSKVSRVAIVFDLDAASPETTQLVQFCSLFNKKIMTKAAAKDFQKTTQMFNMGVDLQEVKLTHHSRRIE